MLNFLSFKHFKLLSACLAAFFLMIHIVLVVIFRHYDVTPMIYINLISIVFYFVMLYLVCLDRLHAFVIATFLEISVHMGLAEYYVGWNSGFQITLIGICILLFYAEYIARTMHLSYTPSVFVVPAAVAAYILPLVINILRPAPYQLPARIESFFQIAWAIILFAIMLPIMQYLVSIATRSQEYLTNEVLHDKLTGLPNRYYMSNFFGKMDKNSQYWIALADIDDFKSINDTYGHNCGDYVLTSIAALIQELPPGITSCRWGGEEFLLAGKTSTSDPRNTLEGLRKRVESFPFQYEEIPLKLTITLGASMFAPTQSIDEWINAADQKLYEGKNHGKNCVLI